MVHRIFTAVRNYQTPLLHYTFFKAKEALCPPLTSVTGNLFRWMLLTERGWKWPRGSGPKRSVSLQVIVPFIVVPDTTVPTPWKGQKNIMVTKNDHINFPWLKIREPIESELCRAHSEQKGAKTDEPIVVNINLGSLKVEVNWVLVSLNQFNANYNILWLQNWFYNFTFFMQK